jgi:hypothetical protein
MYIVEDLDQPLLGSGRNRCPQRYAGTNVGRRSGDNFLALLGTSRDTMDKTLHFSRPRLVPI